MSRILILNGSPRKKGNTQDLINAFSQGAKENNNEVKEIYLNNKSIRGCMGCLSCIKNNGICAIKDDMREIYDAFEKADIIVFASPIYFSSITGDLKTVVDRLFAMWNKYNGARGLKKSAFIISSASPILDEPLLWYSQWENLGIITGKGNPLGQGKAIDDESVIKARELGLLV